ncbi:hypothetical protein BDP27DRAFT_1365865 [Rhodocollybia butyracea]|uniref:Uncharacterized protein n=1 Tax=Rhodocollybia butyracea TaxID=206335 RepID=A0A9P5PLN5_9AGAR|nr:hypothetical protein BDP27DRAFT_1365865 [Rhodocollybia butyracea]
MWLLLPLEFSEKIYLVDADTCMHEHPWPQRLRANINPPPQTIEGHFIPLATVGGVVDQIQRIRTSFCLVLGRMGISYGQSTEDQGCSDVGPGLRPGAPHRGQVGIPSDVIGTLKLSGRSWMLDASIGGEPQTSLSATSEKLDYPHY